MLMGWAPHAVEQGDVVLVWGGAGGLGSLALEIVRAQGGRAVAVVSDDAKKKFCMEHGAVGVINRSQFDHWGVHARHEGRQGLRQLGQGRARLRQGDLGRARRERSSPRIVFEHPGEATLPTSEFVCETGGMIVICAGTTGYNVDARPALPLDAAEALPGQPPRRTTSRRWRVTKLVDEGKVDPCLSQTYRFDELPECHQLMLDNQHPYGNMAVLVNAPRDGAGSFLIRALA